MTMTDQIQKKKRKARPIKVSQRMQEALDGLSLDFDKLQPRVDKVFAIGREEGLKDKVIGKVIRAKMKEHYSQQTIQNVFENYPDAKQKQKHKKVKESVTFDDASICPKCGKPFKDPEEEIWQFNVGEFRIQDVQKAPRTYLETGLEHFYAEARKWKAKYEQASKTRTKPKKDINKEKTALLERGLAWREQGGPNS